MNKFAEDVEKCAQTKLADMIDTLADMSEKVLPQSLTNNPDITKFMGELAYGDTDANSILANRAADAAKMYPPNAQEPQREVAQSAVDLRAPNQNLLSPDESSALVKTLMDRIHQRSLQRRQPI